ncbi:MAG: adenylate/guanylate cyclase domain-containing protein [Alphaproteobacteria bacterium]|nr:adenylate/guanylate cyclase domain-containing protein [Alphaproteobacteria bacterium]
METGATGRPRLRVGLMAALTVGVLALVLSTAALIHFSWYSAARSGSRALAAQINRQIAQSIGQEVSNIIASAEATRESLRTIFFQDVIETTDEAKREFTFLAALQSQPNVGWIAFAWPDGDFFGAEKRGERGIAMVEVRPEGDEKIRQRRVDTYESEPGDIIFKQREFVPSNFHSTDYDWYKRAIEANAPVWVDADEFPTRRRPAIANAAPLIVHDNFLGVLMVAIELDRLSAFLADIRVAKSGTAFIADASGRMIAFPDATAARMPADEDRPSLPRIDAMPAPHARVAAAALAGRTGSPDGQPSEAMLRWQDGNDYLVSATPLKFRDWSVVTVIPEGDFLEEIDRSTRRLATGLAIFALAAALTAVVMSRIFLARPLLRVVGQLRHVEEFRLDRITTQPSRLKEIDDLSAGLAQMGRGLSSFQKFLPTELVRTLVQQGVEARPGGRPRELTVMFTDLVGFTRLSESLGDRIVPILADYLGRMSRLVHDGGGTIDKFIGDAVMAFWGAPQDDPHHAVNACHAALACQRMMPELAHHTASHGLPPLAMRVGLNTGNVLVGNIGSEERLNYTAIGDPVNLASRLEAMNKRYGTAIIIGAATREAAGGAIVTRRLDRVAAYGRQAGEWIYELLDMTGDPAKAAGFDWVALYEIGLDRYGRRDWDGAIVAFEQVIAMRGDDAPARLFIARCRAFHAAPPPEDWDMVTRLEEK